MTSDVEDYSGRRERHLVFVGRATAIIAILIAILTARPLVGSSEQAFQFIQEFTGFFTPGITVIFLLGLFWKRANEAGAIVAAVNSVGLSAIMKYTLPAPAFSAAVNEYLTPFINRMGVVFIVSLVLAVIVSLATPQRPGTDTIDTTDVRYKTSTGFNVGALGVVLILIALYATWW
jgi:SSS family solute:Na+ symporter